MKVQFLLTKVNTEVYHHMVSYYANDGISLRLYTNDDHQEHPLLDYTFREQGKAELYNFSKIYTILNLPFGITYTMNFTTRMEF